MYEYIYKYILHILDSRVPFEIFFNIVVFPENGLPIQHAFREKLGREETGRHG